MLAALIPLWVSCGGPPELVEKSEQLDAEIREIESDLAAVEEQLKAGQKDVTNDYRKAELKLAELKGESARLNAELAIMRDEKQSIENRFKAYRMTYPIN